MSAAEAVAAWPADAAVSAEGVREPLSPPTGETALLQPGMPAGGPSLVVLEGSPAIPLDRGGPREAQRAKPALPGACPEPEARGETSSSGGCEGHPSRIFFRAPVTALAATWSSIEPGDHRCSASVRRSVDTRWSASGSGNDAGGRGGQDPAPHVALRCPPEIVAVVVLRTRGATR